MKIIEKRRGEAIVQLTRQELRNLGQSLRLSCVDDSGVAPEIQVMLNEIEKLADDPILNADRLP